jgi:hypothetical protein
LPLEAALTFANSTATSEKANPAAISSPGRSGMRRPVITVSPSDTADLRDAVTL